MSENIILIGMPGCGKSTCGVRAAKIGCMDFTDTDIVIQQNEKMPLQEIINTKGNDYFAAAEEKWVSRLCVENCIIATGGSVVYSQKAMEHLKTLGRIIYIKIGFDDMKSRITNLDSRGILLKDGCTLKEMYDERQSLYEKYADCIIDCDENSTIEQTAQEILLCK